MLDALKNILDPNSIIQYGGLALLLFVVFAETGLLIGFFLPGDYLIFIAGMICVSNPAFLGVNLPTLITLLSSAAILGNIVGYWFGKKVGLPLFNRPDSRIFKQKYLVKTKAFYDKNGGKTLIFGRFLPIIRTFAPILAGVIKVDFKLFMVYNIVGGIAWISSLTCLGFYLGTYAWVNQNLGFIIIGFIVITLIPLFTSFFKRKNH